MVSLAHIRIIPGMPGADGKWQLNVEVQSHRYYHDNLELLELLQTHQVPSEVEDVFENWSQLRQQRILHLNVQQQPMRELLMLPFQFHLLPKHILRDDHQRPREGIERLRASRPAHKQTPVERIGQIGLQDER